jgi:uncharacterized protein with PIN domain
MPAGGPRSTKFAVDAMLGSLARKLRAFGFDSTYYKEGTDTKILSDCKRQRRVLITADRQLAARAEKRGLRSLLVTDRTDGRRLSMIVKTAGETGLILKMGEARCSLCNGNLTMITPAEAARSVPGALARRHRVFYRCSACGHVYWKGGHWKKLRRLEALFEAKS